MSYRFADSLLGTPDDGQRNCPKHVEFYSKNKFEKLVHLVGFITGKNARCLNLYCATSAPLFTAYLIYLHSEWLAYLYLSFYIVFVSNFHSSFI